MLAPLRNNNSVTCFLFGWGEATAQCWKKSTLVYCTVKDHVVLNERLARLLLCTRPFLPKLSRWSEDVWSWLSPEQASSSLWPCLPPELPAVVSDLWTRLHKRNQENEVWVMSTCVSAFCQDDKIRQLQTIQDQHDKNKINGLHWFLTCKKDEADHIQQPLLIHSSCV